MKRILSVAALLGLLVSCTPTVIPPASSVTGYWKGNLSAYSGVVRVDISAHLKVTDSPSLGDFTGEGSLRGALSVDKAVLSGNVRTGDLSASDGTNTVTCKGTFKNNNQYQGDCQYQNYSAPLYMERVSD